MRIPMRLRLHTQSPTPIRWQLTEQLKHVIEGGGVPRDQALPSIRELAGFLGIKPNPVVRAIEDLKRSGYRPLRPRLAAADSWSIPGAPPGRAGHAGDGEAGGMRRVIAPVEEDQSVVSERPPMSEGARNGEPPCLHGLEKSHALREEGTIMVLPVDVSVRVGRRLPARVLGRLATSGIYLVRGVPRDLQRAARVRAVSENTTLGGVLVQALREYAAGAWTPRP